MELSHTISQGFVINGHPVYADVVERLAAGAPYVRSRDGKKISISAEERAELVEFLKGYKARAAIELGQLNRLAMYG